MAKFHGVGVWRSNRWLTPTRTGTFERRLHIPVEIFGCNLVKRYIHACTRVVSTETKRGWRDAAYLFERLEGIRCARRTDSGDLVAL